MWRLVSIKPPCLFSVVVFSQRYRYLQFLDNTFNNILYSPVPLHKNCEAAAYFVYVRALNIKL